MHVVCPCRVCWFDRNWQGEADDALDRDQSSTSGRTLPMTDRCVPACKARLRQGPESRTLVFMLKDRLRHQSPGLTLTDSSLPS